MSAKTRFLHLLTPAEGRNNYLVAGVVWSGPVLPQFGDTLSMHTEDGHLSIEGNAPGGPRFSWTSYKKITETFCFSQRGFSDSVEAACVAALAFVPKTMTLEYLGRFFNCYGRETLNDGPTVWESEIDGGRCQFSGPYQYGSDPEYYRWEREWKVGEVVLTCSDSRALRGSQPTLRDAVIAAVDAPDLFKRACAKLIASLHQEQ